MSISGIPVEILQKDLRRIMDDHLSHVEGVRVESRELHVVVGRQIPYLSHSVVFLTSITHAYQFNPGTFTFTCACKSMDVSNTATALCHLGKSDVYQTKNRSKNALLLV